MLCTTWGIEPVCIRYRISSHCHSFNVTVNEVKSESKSHSVVSDSLQSHGNSPWNSLGQNTGVGSLFLLQGIFPTQRSNLGLPRCRQILHQLSHQGSPRILEWLAYPFPGAVPDSGIKPGSLALQADSLPAELPGKPTWPSKPKIFI